MFTYYLCNDNETIYRIEFLVKEEDMSYYLSLLENYLSELVFIEESESKKLVKEEKIGKENKDIFNIENGQIMLKKTVVSDVTKIEDYLPFVVTLKMKRYFFLRSFTIYVLMKLLDGKLDKINHPYLKKLEKVIGYSSYIDFNLLLTIFFGESGNLIPNMSYDYYALTSLLEKLEGKITEKYSRSALASFWQGDEAERELAESIVTNSKANKQALKILKLDSFGIIEN